MPHTARHGSNDDGDDGSDGEDASVDSLNLSTFLEDAEGIDGVGFSSASGINARRVAEAVIGTIAFAFAYGVNAVIDAVSSAVSTVIGGVSDFLADGLIASTFGVAQSAIEGAWSFSVAEFGLGAFPLALVAMIATFYVASWGLNTAQEVVQ